MIYNDSICEILEGIYIGGVESNVRRTLPLVDVWIYLGYEYKKVKDLKNKFSNVNFIYSPFDDGDLRKGQEVWLDTFEFIKCNRDKKILISCVEGISRSAVLGLWILCEELGNYDEALKTLKSKRKIYFDRGFNDFILYLKEVYQ